MLLYVHFLFLSDLLTCNLQVAFNFTSLDSGFQEKKPICFSFSSTLLGDLFCAFLVPMFSNVKEIRLTLLILY